MHLWTSEHNLGLQDPYWGPIGGIWGLSAGYTGIVEKKMETTIWGLGFWVSNH